MVFSSFCLLFLILSAPSISLLLPNSGPCFGTYQIAIFGLNFLPSTRFHVRFGDLLRFSLNIQFIMKFSTHIEFHCSTAVVVTINMENHNIYPGEGTYIILKRFLEYES